MREILESVRVLRSIPAEVRARHEGVETLEQKFGRWQKVRLPELPLEQRPYEPVWPQWFADERERIASALGSGVAGEDLLIEHYGSTSIPGLASKNIIDIAVGLGGPPDLRASGAALSGVGYTDYGNSPIDPETWWYWRVERDRAFVVHLCERLRPWVADMVDLRDYLRSHPAERERYSQLKQRLAAQTGLSFLQFTISKMSIWIDLIDKAKCWRAAEEAPRPITSNKEDGTSC